MNATTQATQATEADSLARDITERTDSGFPFGYLHRESEGVFSDKGEAMAEVEHEHRDTWHNLSDDDKEAAFDEMFTEASGFDYLQDVLDIKYIVNSDGTYDSALVCIAFGGPTAWINTRTHSLEVSWWSAPEYRELPREFIVQLDDALAELWEMR